MARSLARAFLGCLVRRLSRELCQDELAQSAVVFSPHFDDEILGCGGTLLRKRETSATVRIVFMTDGRKSHRDWIPEDELRHMRRREAMSASRLLGLESDDVICLDFEDGQLRQHQNEAIQRVVKLLKECQPEQIFVPYSLEPPADHAVTFEIVAAALNRWRKPVTVYQYPIWFWVHWPWTPLPQLGRRGFPKRVLGNLLSLTRLIRDFRSGVDISDVLHQKRVALEQYRSQMFRMRNKADWPILEDVAEGEFLDCFFQQREVFSQSVWRERNDDV